MKASISVVSYLRCIPTAIFSLVLQVAIFIIYIVTGIYGTEFWKFSIVSGITCGTMFEMMLYLGSLVSSLPMSFYNIYQSYKEKTGKMLGPVEALRPLISPVILFSVFTLWVVFSPNNIIERDPRLFMWLIGAVFANINVSIRTMNSY